MLDARCIRDTVLGFSSTYGPARLPRRRLGAEDVAVTSRGEFENLRVAEYRTRPSKPRSTGARPTKERKAARDGIVTTSWKYKDNHPCSPAVIDPYLAVFAIVIYTIRTRALTRERGGGKNVASRFLRFRRRGGKAAVPIVPRDR